MPQSERSQIMKELLRWLNAKSKKGVGASTHEVIHHCMSEITSLGATERRVQGYIKTLDSLGFIKIYRLKWKITETGKNWLQRKKGL